VWEKCASSGNMRGRHGGEQRIPQSSILRNKTWGKNRVSVEERSRNAFRLLWTHDLTRISKCDFRTLLSPLTNAYNTRLLWFVCSYRILNCAVPGFMCHNYHNSGHYTSSCLLFETQLNSIGLNVPHRKHITSPLRAQQVNAIYRFVTMVY
jgi:hypothetical protein